MAKLDGLRIIRLGFVTSFLALSIPTFCLFYHLLSENTSLMQEARSEIEGTQRIEALINKLAINHDPKLLVQIRDLGDEYKFVFDHSLDIHYITVVALHRLPTIYANLEDFREQMLGDDPLIDQAMLQLKAVLDSQISETNRSIRLAHAADLGYYGENEKLTSVSYDELYQKTIESYFLALKSGKVNDIQASLDSTVSFWKMNLAVLVSLQHQKMAQLENERTRAIEITLAFWILSVSLMAAFTNRLLSAQGKLQLQLDEQNLRLNVASKMSAIGEMSAGIAHEINTPLAAIRLNAEMLVESAELNELTNDEAKQIGNTVVQVVDQISRIIMSMRKISRHDIEDVSKTENFGEIFNDVLVLCGSNLKKNGVKLSSQVPDDLWIHCRQVEIAQVLINLINNAVDACSASIDKQIKITAIRERENLVLRIEDSGPQITDEVRRLLFKQTFTTKAAGKGTGMGLQIVSNILKSYGGSIVLADQSQTCFQLRLPCKQLPFAELEAA